MSKHLSLFAVLALCGCSSPIVTMDDAARPDASFEPSDGGADAFVADAYVDETDASAPDAFALDAFVPDAFTPDAFVPPSHAWVSVGLSSQHACAVRADGAVHCWGADVSGQLGDGTANARHLAPVASMVTRGAIDVAAGALISGHTCAVLESGRVACWGLGTSGQLGQGVLESSLTPVEAIGIDDAVQVEAGIDFTCVLRATGQVSCFGDRAGRGAGPSGDSAMPATIPELADIVQISAGTLHACALERSGQVWCWGYNEDYRVGVDSFATVARPVMVPGVDDADQVVAGGGFTCALRGDRVSCWGDNEHGQLGGGSAGDDSIAPVTQTFADPAELALGHSHACVRNGDGSVLCWGRNNTGQLGNRSDADSHVPVAVHGLTGAHDIEAAGGTTCAMVGDELLCWGNNYEGMLGIGSRTSSFEPVEVWLP